MVGAFKGAPSWAPFVGGGAHKHVHGMKVMGEGRRHEKGGGREGWRVKGSNARGRRGERKEWEKCTTERESKRKEGRKGMR